MPCPFAWGRFAQAPANENPNSPPSGHSLKQAPASDHSRPSGARNRAGSALGSVPCQLTRWANAWVDLHSGCALAPVPTGREDEPSPSPPPGTRPTTSTGRVIPQASSLRSSALQRRCKQPTALAFGSNSPRSRSPLASGFASSQTRSRCNPSSTTDGSRLPSLQPSPSGTRCKHRRSGSPTRRKRSHPHPQPRQILGSRSHRHLPGH
jgi:hypothetical protein